MAVRMPKTVFKTDHQIVLSWPHSFSSSMERAERFWRHNAVIWQLVK